MAFLEDLTSRLRLFPKWHSFHNKVPTMCICTKSVFWANKGCKFRAPSPSGPGCNSCVRDQSGAPWPKPWIDIGLLQFFPSSKGFKPPNSWIAPLPPPRSAFETQNLWCPCPEQVQTTNQFRRIVNRKKEEAFMWVIWSNVIVGGFVCSWTDSMCHFKLTKLHKLYTDLEPSLLSWNLESQLWDPDAKIWRLNPT